MASTASLRRFTLLQKEIQEYKLSFVWTPVIVAVVLTLLMFASVLVAGRISISLRCKRNTYSNWKFTLNTHSSQPLY